MTRMAKAPVLTHEEVRHYSDGDSIAVTYYYEGPVCPDCDRVAYCRKGGHASDCRFWAVTPAREPQPQDHPFGPMPPLGSSGRPNIHEGEIGGGYPW